MRHGRSNAPVEGQPYLVWSVMDDCWQIAWWKEDTRTWTVQGTTQYLTTTGVTHYAPAPAQPLGLHPTAVSVRVFPFTPNGR